MNKKIAEKVTAIIADYIEKNQRLPWDQGILPIAGLQHGPISWTSGKEYNGVNRFLLAFCGPLDGEYATFKAIAENGGKVKKGAKGLPVIYGQIYNFTQRKPYNKEEAEPDDEVGYFEKLSHVFNVLDSDTVTGNFKSKRKTPVALPEIQVISNEQIDNDLNSYTAAEKIAIEYDATKSAFFRHNELTGEKSIHMFRKEYWTSSELYYSTFLHECIHSTGIPLKRSMNGRFGKSNTIYSKEEIVAETGAMLLCQHYGISTDKEEKNSSEYIRHWSECLKKNPDWLVEGIRAGEKAADYFLKVASQI